MNKHEDILTLLPPPKSIPPEEFCEYKMQMREIHKITVKLPKKKKKKGKKKWFIINFIFIYILSLYIYIFIYIYQIVFYGM